MSVLADTVRGSRNQIKQKIVGSLNVYTMETGDGRELELTFLDGYICWRRVNDVEWIRLVSASEFTPEKGIDYWTEEDKLEVIEYTAEYMSENITHSDIQGCSESDLHPITSIIGLEDKLNSIAQDKNYVHHQKTASDTWHIVHNLNKYPNITIIDSASNVVVGEVSYIDTQSVTIKLKGAFSGKAFLN